MIGLVIPIYNRHECLEISLESLRKSVLPGNMTIVLINDASMNRMTNKLFSTFNIVDVNIIKITNRKRLNVWGTLRKGFDYIYKENCDIMINLDSDMLVNPDWLERIIKLYAQFPENIISGYNCRIHGGIEKFENYRFKDSTGGANLAFSRKLYPFIRPFFDMKLGWDWKMGLAYSATKKFVVTVPSTMDHLGERSTLKYSHNSRAEDFTCLTKQQDQM